MPTITALLHTYNDALRLGRCLETLYPCDEILVVDRGSTDATVRLAREYGARVLIDPNTTPEQIRTLVHAKSPADDVATWIFCLEPCESLSEALAASLYEWKSQPADAAAFSVFLREETSMGWIAHTAAQTRLVPPQWKHWNATLPSPDPSAVALEGELLRFVFP